jgi:hypothetical protein
MLNTSSVGEGTNFNLIRKVSTLAQRLLNAT